jgi:bisphosphoglycerate-independent phosphoglycerate mutase (AlkP superfamily)
MKTKILCILDGFGIGPDSINNAITRAKMPNLRRIMSEYFWTTLEADGEGVGQEAGLVGNSEVGHMNIGGLQLVPQLSYQITQSAKSNFEEKQIDQSINPNQFLKNKFQSSSSVIHLLGLFSTGTIHSDLRHWAGAIESAGKAGATKIVLHLMSDGRDSDKKSLMATWNYFISEFKNRLEPFEGRIFLGSLGGRFYGMDRDNNMDRSIMGIMPMFDYKIVDSNDQGDNKAFAKYFLEKYYVDIVDINKKLQSEIEQNNDLSENSSTKNFYYSGEICQQFIKQDKLDRQNGKTQLDVEIKIAVEELASNSYLQNRFDETILPTSFYYNNLLDDKIKPPYGIQKSDTLWLINFRSDRMKQITKLLCQINQEFDLNLDILSMNDFGIDEQYKYVSIFRTQKVQNTLAQTIAKHGQTQLHIAETEKYAHVTYFLNGGSQEKNQGEDWELIPSNKVNSHAEKPEMKAKEITDYILDKGLDKYNYIIANYANPDMVAHTGLVPESIESIEFLDEQLGRLISAVENGGHSLIIIADHGNCEFVGEYTRKTFSFSQESKKQIETTQNLTDTEHNPNPVPCIIIDTQTKNFDKQNKIKFLDSVLNTHKQNNLDTNLEEIKRVLDQNNKILVGTNWPTQDQINELKQGQLPLWYAGVLLLSL